MIKRAVVLTRIVPLDEPWPRPTVVQWAGLALAATLLAAAAAASIHEHLGLDEAQARLEAVRAPGAHASAGAASAPAASPKQLEELNAAIRALNVPVPALMTAVTAPAGLQVALDSLEFKPGTSQADGQLTIVAEATDPDTMVDYLDLLAVRRPLREVSLVKHELIAGSIGMTVRFEAQARWHARTP